VKALLAAAVALSVAGMTLAAQRQVEPAPAFQAEVRLDGMPTQGALVRGRASPPVTALILDDQPVTLAADGSFVLGFDRDAPAIAILKVRSARAGLSMTDERRLRVAPRAWRLEQVDAAYRPPGFDVRRPAELERIAAARAVATDAQGWRQAFRWPATGRLSGLFGAQRIYRGQPGGYHGGADVALPTGAPVTAPADGVVVLAAAAPFTLEGRLLMLDHGAGLSSAFLHLSRIDVREGEAVRQGQRIGAVGATGRATGPHLHWGVQWRGAKLDPLLVAGAMPVR
jgi:murein DD-endopeptidase MepM/ murein hydrolase activator NlpD